MDEEAGRYIDSMAGVLTDSRWRNKMASDQQTYQYIEIEGINTKDYQIVIEILAKNDGSIDEKWWVQYIDICKGLKLINARIVLRILWDVRIGL